MNEHGAPELILVLANAMPGRDDEFSTWYTEEHLPEVVRLPGIVSAQRYVLPDSFVGQMPHKYATVYEIEGSAAEAMHTIYTAEYETRSDSLDVAGMVMCPFVPLGTPIASA